MPVLRFPYNRLEKLTGLNLNSLEEILFRLKCEMDTLDEYIEIEVNPDRPDMYIGEGIARAVNGLLGKRRGWKIEEPIDSGLILYNDKPEGRPYIAAGVVYNVNVSESYIEELVQFQEKLHDTIGRRRRKIAIGLHDLRKLPGRVLRYKLSPYSEEMTPLGKPDEKWSIKEVLENTPQGLKYSYISSTPRGHPALYAGDEIIAIPPVINSDITRIESGTRDLFIDVTGNDRNTVNKVLDIITSTLAERDNARIGYVRIFEDKSDNTTPLLLAKTVSLDINAARRVLGSELDSFTIMDSLSRMLYNVEIVREGYRVIVPPFRVDVISYIDLIEDIAIAIGYENIGYNRPTTIEPGKLLPETLVTRVLRDLAIGLGFTEVMQLTLTSPSILNTIGIKDFVEVENPVQLEYSALRPSLIPSLLSILSRNQHARKPVKIFEIGNVILPGEPPPDEIRFGLAIMDDEVGYEDIQAYVYSIMRVLNIDFNVEKYSHDMFIPGRSARILLNNEVLAVLGEINPVILQSLGINYPVALAEIRVEVLAKWISRMSNP